MTNLDIIENLKPENKICIIGHIDPDADALASMTVLKDFLTKHKLIETVDIFGETNQVQENCLFMLKGHTLNPISNLSELKTKIYDVSIAVDSPNIDRLGIYKDLFKNAKQTIVIDHHQTSLNFGQTNIIENASSTSEIIFNILENFHYSFTVPNYENIYSGIITDTNNFTTPNTNKNTFLIASKIIEKINFVEIYDNFFSNYPINSIKLLSYAYKNIISLKNNQILISYLNKKHYKKTKTNQNNISGIVNKISTISGNILTCLIFEKNNNFYVSLRAKNGYNVAEIAKKFNGGGHAGAAGFLTKLSIKKIIKLISKEFLNILI